MKSGQKKSTAELTAMFISESKSFDTSQCEDNSRASD